jgi:two-component SAPR family response regulator
MLSNKVNELMGELKELVAETENNMEAIRAAKKRAEEIQQLIKELKETNIDDEREAWAEKEHEDFIDSFSE